MTANIYLISGGTNYYISLDGAARTYYSGSGTPWTTQSTTPYDIAMNDVTGQRWTPQNSPRQEVYGGGPPFRNGQSLIYTSYGNVIETIPLQIYATSHDNAVTLLQQLRRILNTALYSTPCILAVKPDGSTNTVYYDIYGADVQEDARFINDESQPFQSPQSKGVLRTVITLRRSPHGALITAGETVLNALTFTNTGTGANNNTQAMSAASGDLIYEGQPLNISIKPASAGTSVRRMLLGSVLNRTYSTTGAGAGSNSSTTVPTTFNTLANWTLTDKLTNAGIKPRIVLRFSTAPSHNCLLRLAINYAASSANTFYTPWVSAVEPLQDERHQLVDMGTFPIDIVRRNGVLTAPATTSIILQGLSDDGISATATLGYSEYIWYYDWARIDTLFSFSANGTHQLNIDQFPEATGVPATPWPDPGAIVSASSSSAIEIGDVRGRLPRHFSGASLYLGWINTSGNHTTSHTATVSARVSPQWNTLRGAD